jgi:adenylate cyclase
MTTEDLVQEVRNAMNLRDPKKLRELQPHLAEQSTLSGKALEHYVRGLIDEFTGSFNDALVHYDRALEQYTEEHDDLWRSYVLNNIGCVHYFASDYSSAVEYFERTLEIKQRIGEPFTSELNNLGAVYFNIGDFPKAAEYWERALDLYLKKGAEGPVADVYLNLGNLYGSMDLDVERSIEMYQRCMEIDRRLGRWNHLVLALYVLALRLSDSNRHAEALVRVVEARELIDEGKGTEHRDGVLSTMLSILVASGRHEEAARLINEHSMLEIPNPVSRNSVLRSLASIRLHENDLEGGLQFLQEELASAEEHGLKSIAANVHLEIRELAKRMRSFDLYVQHNEAHLRLEEEVRGRDASIKLAVQRKERELETERAEAQRQRNLLYNTLPRAIADRILHGEDVSGDIYERSVILFLDIVDFTRRSSPLHPKQTTSLLQLLFTQFDEICERHSVMKVKTIGDSYMAAVFEGTSMEDMAIRGANAATEMMSISIEWPDGSPLQFRIGMHSGPSVAGVIGTNRLQYDVWGDTVNVASRMESTSEPGRIQVSEVFAQALKALEGDGLQERGTVEIKGKGQMKTYWLKGV